MSTGTAFWRLDINAAAAGVPPHLVEAIMSVESDGQNLAVNSAGAVGLMQVIPEVWPELGAKYAAAFNVAFGEVFSIPEASIDMGVEILEYLGTQQCGSAEQPDWFGAICAYQSGHCVPDGSSDGNMTDFEYVQAVMGAWQELDDGVPDVSASFAVSDRISVADGPLHLRSTPSLSADILTSLSTGTELCVVGESQPADGYTWCQIEDVNGTSRGWVAGEFCFLVTAQGC